MHGQAQQCEGNRVHHRGLRALFLRLEPPPDEVEPIDHGDQNRQIEPIDRPVTRKPRNGIERGGNHRDEGRDHLDPAQEGGIAQLRIARDHLGKQTRDQNKKGSPKKGRRTDIEKHWHNA